MGQAQASINYGWTQGQPGVVDAKSGLKWVLADSLANGQALGFRAATTAEFQQLLLDTGWTTAPQPNQYAFNTGSQDTEQRYGYSVQVTNIPNWTFILAIGMGYSYENDINDGFEYDYGVAGALDGGTSGLYAVMADKQVTHTERTTPTTVHNFNAALVGKLPLIASGSYDSASVNAYNSANMNWSTMLVNKDPLGSPDPSSPDFRGYLNWAVNTSGYFMVASVPEPSTWLSMSLGLLALTGVARRRSA